ncbi:MAG: Fic family protein [Myxococcales bacterium]|nr:Fic family protein [Myxococcales bacterium]
MEDWISQPATVFHGRPLPERATPAGYAALIHRYDLKLPLPLRLAAIAERHAPRSTDTWRLLSPRHAPANAVPNHLVFALKYEGVDLAVLSFLFDAVAPNDIAAIVRATPTGTYARRIWFLYEWLTGTVLDLPDARRIRIGSAVDPKLQIALRQGTLSTRHRIYDNLPGTRAFCPMIRRTATIGAYQERDLATEARAVAGRTHPDVMARAAAFLLLSDSKASFSIEGERPSQDRAARWGRIIGEAGAAELSVAEFERLQKVVIGDARFVKLGLRTEGGFVGKHDRRTGEPLPEHISARAEDLRSLLEGVVAYIDGAILGGVDPVATAAAAAFGFVYTHPFEDGNGRVHRWIFHHVLAASGFSQPGLVFPVSAAILRSIDAYRTVLRSYSGPLLPFIDWRATPQNNVEVLNDTARYYRYFDATAHAEYLYACVAETVDRDLPQEVAYLDAFDRFAERVQRVVDMPDRMIALLARFLEQSGGSLSARARAKEFQAFNEAEATAVEAAFAETIGAIERS